MRCLTLVAALVLAMGPASAQDYPTRPITVIVPFPAGGPTDTIARVTAQSMSKLLGQQVIVENVSGAGGTLGTGRASRSAPDGYTLLLHHLGLATADTLYRKLPYSTKKGFTPIGLVTDAPMVFVGKSDLAPNTFGELVAFAKKQGEKVTFATAGVGSSSQLCALLFMSAIQTKLTQVPYKGGGPLMNDLIGRPGRHGLRAGDDRDAAGPGQAHQGLCGDDQGAAAVARRPADRRRSRPEGLRARRLARPLCAGGHAGADRAEALRRAARRARRTRT